MPITFENLSDDVAKGAEDVKRMIGEMAESAEKADEMFKKFNKTQEATIEVAAKFKAGAIRGLRSLNTASIQVATSLSGISKAFDAKGFAADFGGARQRIEELTASIEGLEGKLQRLSRRRAIPPPVMIDEMRAGAARAGKTPVRVRSKSKSPLTIAAEEGAKSPNAKREARRAGLEVAKEESKRYLEGRTRALRSGAGGGAKGGGVPSGAGGGPAGFEKISNQQKMIKSLVAAKTREIGQIESRQFRGAGDIDQSIKLSVDVEELETAQKVLDNMEWEGDPSQKAARLQFYKDLNGDVKNLASAMMGLESSVGEVHDELDKVRRAAKFEMMAKSMPVMFKNLDKSIEEQIDYMESSTIEIPTTIKPYLDMKEKKAVEQTVFDFVSRIKDTGPEGATDFEAFHEKAKTGTEGLKQATDELIDKHKILGVLMRRAGAEARKEGISKVATATKFFKELQAQNKELRNQIELMGDVSKIGGDSAKRQQFKELSGKLRGRTELEDFLKDIPRDTEEAREAAEKLFEVMSREGPEKVIEACAEMGDQYKLLGLRIQRNMEEAKQSAEELTSVTSRLRDEIDKATKAGNVIGSTFAEGKLEAAQFAGGLGATATGMMAVGVATAYMAKKIGDLASKFADAAVALARYKVETAATERTIIGLNDGALEGMRKDLDLTRAQATAFFDVVKQGTNEMGLSSSKIMEVSNALKATFGGDQTERLQKYIDLLKTIPTLEADMKITASMDDQAAAIYGLAQAGKMDVLMDLQTAGLFGGEQKKQSGAEMADTAQRTAEASEAIKDFLMTNMFPKEAIFMSEMVEWGSKGVETLSTLVGWAGALKMFLGQAHIRSLAATDRSARTISTAIYQTSGKNVPSVVGAGGTASADKASKSMGILSKSAMKAGVAIGGILAATKLATWGLEKWSGSLQEEGYKVASAGVSFGKSMTKMAGYAAAGAVAGSLITGPLAPFGAAIGAAAGALYGFATEFDDLSKSVPAIAKAYFGKRDAISSKEWYAASKLSSIQMMKLAKSGMALQRAMESIKIAFGSAKFQLYEMQKALAATKLENLSEIGGNLDSFGAAVSFASVTTRKMYALQLKTAADERAKIMREGDFNAAERRNALNELRQVELNSMKEFVAGMNAAIAALFKSPKIIQAGLQAATSQAILDFEAMGGGLNEVQLRSNQENQLAELRDKAAETEAAVRDTGLKTAEKIADLNKQRESQEKLISGEIIELEKRRSGVVEAGVAEAQGDYQAAMEAAKKAGKNVTGVWGKIGIKLGGAAAARLLDPAGIVPGNMMAPILGEAGMYLQQRKDRNANEEEIADTDANLEAAARRIVSAQAKKLASDKQLAMLQAASEKIVNEKGETVGYKVNADKAKKQIEEAAKEEKIADRQIAELKEDMAGKFSTDMLESSRKTYQEYVAAQKEMKTANAKYEEIEGGGEGDIVTAGESKRKAMARQLEAEKNLGGALKVLSEGLLSLDGYKINPANVKGIAKMLIEVKGGVGDVENALGIVHPDLAKAAKKGLTESSERAEQLEVLEERKGAAERVKNALQAVVDSENGINERLRDNLNNVEAMKAITQEIVDAYSSQWKQLGTEVQVQQRTAEAAKRSAGLAGMIGDGIAERAKASQEESKALEMLAESYEGHVKRMKADIPGMEQAVKYQLKAVKSAALEFSKAKSPEDVVAKKTKLDNEKAILIERQSKLTGTEKAINDAGEAAQNARENLGMAGSAIARGMEEFNRGLAGTQLQHLESLSETMFQAAEYGGNVAENAQKGFEVAKEAANKRFKFEMENSDEMYKADLENNKRRAASAADQKAAEAGITDPNVINAMRDRIKAEMDATSLAEKRAKLAEIEFKRKQSVVAAAEKERDIRNSELDLTQGLLDDVMSFASEFGGSFSSIMAIQSLQVDNARAQLDVSKHFRDQIQNTFEQAAGDAERQRDLGFQLNRANIDVAQKTLAVRRKEMGVQKDMMDRMLGAVFGELRSDVGARRGRGSMQAMMGLDATRMKNAAGMFIPVPGGKPGTIAERAAERTVGRGGAGTWKGLEGAEGVIGEAFKTLTSTPTKTAEDRLAAAMKGAEDNTGQIAENTKALVDIAKGGAPAAAKAKTEKLDAADKAEQEQETSSGGVRARGRPMTLGGGKFDPWSKTLGGGTFEPGARKLGGGASPVTGMGGVSARRTPTAGGVATAAGGVTKNVRPAMETLPPTSGTQVAAAPKAGAGGASQEFSTLSLKGEMLVKFDNNAFKDQIATVVASLIKTPQIAKAIQTVGWDIA